jgi:hypothetical protein
MVRMDQGVAAVLAAGVAGAAGAAGAVVGSWATSRSARRQAVHEQALRERSAAVEAIDAACNSFHVKGYTAIQAVLDLEAAVVGGLDGLPQDRHFSASLSAAIAATYEIRWADAGLEEPARQWCDAIQKIGKAVRALRDSPEAIEDAASPVHHAWKAAWAREREVLLALQRKVQETKEESARSVVV